MRVQKIDVPVLQRIPILPKCMFMEANSILERKTSKSLGVETPQPLSTSLNYRPEVHIAFHYLCLLLKFLVHACPKITEVDMIVVEI